jgi:uncharacterized protein (TIGR02466 family)
VNKQKMSLWSTDIYQVQLDLDLDTIWSACSQHQQENQSSQRSNRGGYQGHGFHHADLTAAIEKTLPTVPGRSLSNIHLHCWVNINGFGHWNALHNHLDELCLISGVFYVSVPENSGSLWLYDPRYFGNTGTHYRYYHSDHTSYSDPAIEIQPRPNLMVFFPPSIMHMAGPNLSQDPRCSIAFNIYTRDY